MQTEDQRKLREVKKYLRDLTKTVSMCLDALDAEMKRQSSPDRGKRIAHICSHLNMSNDIAKRFGLGERN